MRGGARAGAGAPRKEKTREKGILIKFTEEELIVLDISAEVAGMKRTQFIRYCIDKEISRQAGIE